MSEKTYKIQVDGLKDLQKRLKAVDKTAPVALRIALNSVADIVIKHGRPLVPKRTGAAQKSWKARSTRTESRVSYGGPRAPYMPWLDWGGRVGRRKRTVRPFLKDGRYLYPTVKKHKTEIQRVADDGLADVARDAGLDVD
jgi:hypothetical protein